MSHFATPVSAYAHGPLVSVSVDTPIQGVLALMEERNISAVPVLSRNHEPVGVISRTDLLRIGTPKPRATPSKSGVFELPAQRAEEVMHKGVASISRETSVAAAAKRMVHDRMHRLFVANEHGALIEVFGTREVMMAVWEARVATPIGEIMSRKPFTVAYDAKAQAAIERLEQAHTHGVVVLDPEGWPIGVFTQREALLARAFPAEATVEETMSHGMLCLHETTPLYRAAAQAAQTRARRVLVTRDRTVVGVVTGLDFARMAHGT